MIRKGTILKTKIGFRYIVERITVHKKAKSALREYHISPVNLDQKYAFSMYEPDLKNEIRKRTFILEHDGNFRTDIETES